ncbi:Alpha-(1,3)-fucosyltransferase C, partial [Armadillidium vulgare]
METPNQLQINYLRAFPENFFNWTMGYRLDSDVYEPFGRVSKKGTDYISERIFKAWKYGAIPVVFGEANYSSIAPPNSYIDSKDFDSISKLAEYMKKVASNSSLYN